MLFPELHEVLDTEPHSAPLNMAIDEVLLRHADQPLLRIYRWREPTVSFGYFDRIDEVESAAMGRAVVRRWTGGGIVEHGEDLTYTLVVPREHAFFRHPAPESYRLIHEAIAGLLISEGISARVLAAAEGPVASACFISPVQYNLVCGGMKIGGAAQRRTRWGLLHQGSIQTKQPPAGLQEKLASVFAAKISRCSLAPELQEEAVALAKAKYATAAWLQKY